MGDKLAARQKVIDLALTFVGSHYVWGSAGATPGGHDGSIHRPGTVTMAPFSWLSFYPVLNAASCNGSGEIHICPGRCDYRTVNGGVVISPDDKEDLAKFLESFHPSTWRADKFYVSRYFPLTPRFVWGSKSDDRYLGKTVWGEDCRGKRHFDCIGFINYVFNQTSKTRNTQFPFWSAEIGQWFSPTDPVVPMDAPAVPGDILFRDGPVTGKPDQKEWKHIALLADDGHVVQAQMSAMGVHADEIYNMKNWTARRRVRDVHFD